MQQYQQKMSQDFIFVVEKTVWQNKKEVVKSEIQCSDSVFHELFNVPYPVDPAAGHVIGVDVDGKSLDLCWQYEVTKSISKSVCPVTDGTWDLFKLFARKGFRLLQQRNYEKVEGDSPLKGKKLVERVFVRDATK